MRPVPLRQEPFSFHLIPTKGCLLLCSTLPLVSVRTRNEGSREGRSACQVQAEKKNLSLSLFVWFSVELISALLISGWYSTRSSSPRGREGDGGEKGVENKNKQPLPSPTISGEIGLCHTHKHTCTQTRTFSTRENR